MKNFKNIDWLSGRATVVPLSWLQAGLSGGEWNVGIYLLSITTAKTNADKNDIAGSCRASHETIAAKLGRNEKAIGRDVRSLIRKGCIKKVHQGSGKSRLSNVYKILDPPQGNEMVALQGNEMVALEDLKGNETVPIGERNGSQRGTKRFPKGNEMVAPSMSSSESYTESYSMSLIDQKEKEQDSSSLSASGSSFSRVLDEVDTVLYRGKPIPSLVVDALVGQLGRLEDTATVALDFDNTDCDVVDWLMHEGVTVFPPEVA